MSHGADRTANRRARRPPRAARTLPAALALIAAFLVSTGPAGALQESAPVPRTPGGPPRAGPDEPPPGADLAGLAGLLGSGGAPRERAPFTETIPGTVVSIEMLPVGEHWMSATEITWDAYDVLVFGLDRARDEPAVGGDGLSRSAPPAPGATPAESPTDAVPAGAPSDPRPFDAIVRPTKPHIVTDRGFGHAGYPAMSMSAQGAEAFCVWLSGVTGRRYRLPTESEWAAACLAGGPGPWSCGAEPDCLDGCAWFRENADRKTHPVGSKAPNALGLHDLHGNVAEWCRNAGGGHVLKGGSFRDRAIELRADAGQQPSPAWNQSDPNLPRSVWWLADAPFAGFRVVCEDGPDR